LQSVEFIDEEKKEELSNPFSKFLSRILNPQTIQEVVIEDKEYYNQWMHYICVRKLPETKPYIDFSRPDTFIVYGMKGSGKSSLLENISVNYPKIIDLYGSRDDECLASLRIYKYRKTHEKGLIIRSPNTDVVSSWNSISYDKMSLNDIANHDVIVVPQGAFEEPKVFFFACEKLISLIRNRKDIDDHWFMIARELANILYSRVVIRRSNIDQAKAHLIYLMREMRHVGIAFGGDAQYSLSIDREVRINADYLFLKNMGSDKIPSEYSWMYRWFKILGFMSLRKEEFVCKSRTGNLFAGVFQYPPWHKEEKENIYKSLGIKFEKSEPIPIEVVTGTSIDTVLHNEIIVAYSQLNSIKGTARATQHNVETVRKHVKMHKEKMCPCYEA
jgi:hypothetical protein